MTERESYELMKKIKENINYTYPNGFDYVSVDTGDAKDIIKWLLKNDLSVKHLELRRRGGR